MAGFFEIVELSNGDIALRRQGNYDESILQFQSFALANPPESLKDNIVFWIGSNYVKLEMYEDAITQFEMVINSYLHHHVMNK